MLTLQVNAKGAWRNVVQFDPANLDRVRVAVRTLQLALDGPGDPVTWAILTPSDDHPQGRRQILSEGVPGVCERCGCTELSACEGASGLPCHWVTPSRMLCSECVGAPS